MKIIPILGLLTIVMMIVGVASFGAAYDIYDWWPDVGFYFGLIAGILNIMLAVVSLRMRE
ncbi:MAG: hypothetical protein RBG13Loki_1967 [Promethearchaeota archaeon CR_4]|nr:MAG: hypothetical protein RBG13Loki_1967 [Candidatus Lokiarchaeota archaeon CR_4]